MALERFLVVDPEGSLAPFVETLRRAAGPATAVEVAPAFVPGAWRLVFAALPDVDEPLGRTEAPVVGVAAGEDEARAKRALRAGAFDVVDASCPASRLVRLLDECADETFLLA